MADNGGRTARRLYLGVVVILLVVLGVFFLQRYPQVSIMSAFGVGARSHVIVVGGGLAGLSATIEAVQHGATVTIVEKEERLGGNSAKATSGINGVGTRTQEEHEISDSVEHFIKDIIASGGGRSDVRKVRVLAEQSSAAIDFLSERGGLNLSDIVQLGGHSAARTHRFRPTADGKPVPVGFTIINALRTYVEQQLGGYVTVRSRCAFQGLHSDHRLRADGVYVRCAESGTDSGGGGKTELIKGTVVLTSGGYANDHTDTSLLRQYTPDLAAYPTTNGPWATGDVIKVLRKERSISLVDMDQVQVHPTGFVDVKNPTFHTKFLAPEALRGCGALLLDRSGRRFANELGRRDYLTERILEHGWHYANNDANPMVAAMLLTDDVINKFSAPSAGFYKFKGLIVDVDTLAGAAEHLDVSEQVLRDTLTSYAAAAADSEDEFGKAVFPTPISADDHFFVAYVTPTLHYCMGGIEINTQAQVLVDNNGVSAPLAGVYAAGEVTGGVHGRNRLGGNSLLECVVFGRIAGRAAAHYVPDDMHGVS